MKTKKKTLEAALRGVREQYHRRILAELQGTDKTYRQVAQEIGVSEALVYLVNRLSRSRTESEEITIEGA